MKHLARLLKVALSFVCSSLLLARIMTDGNAVIPNQTAQDELAQEDNIATTTSANSPIVSPPAGLPHYDPKEVTPYWNDWSTTLGPGLQPVEQEDFIDPRVLSEQNIAQEGCNSIVQQSENWFITARVGKEPNWQPMWWNYFVEWVDYFDDWRKCKGVKFYDDQVCYEMLWLSSKLAKDEEKSRAYESLLPPNFDTSEMSEEVTNMLQDLNMPVARVGSDYPKKDAVT